MGFSQSSTVLEQLDSLGRHSDCITDISIIDSICASGSFDRTCKIWNLKDKGLKTKVIYKLLTENIFRTHTNVYRTFWIN